MRARCRLGGWCGRRGLDLGIVLAGTAFTGFHWCGGRQFIELHTAKDDDGDQENGGFDQKGFAPDATGYLADGTEHAVGDGGDAALEAFRRTRAVVFVDRRQEGGIRSLPCVVGCWGARL